MDLIIHLPHMMLKNGIFTARSCHSLKNAEFAEFAEKKFLSGLIKTK